MALGLIGFVRPGLMDKLNRKLSQPPKTRPRSQECSLFGLSINYSMRDLVEHERMHPAIVRRLDDMCRVVEV